MNDHEKYTNMLQDKLDRDLVWRKKEIIDFSSLILTASGDSQITLIRASITILYAHWEGFIKNASINYLDFICKMNLTLSELTENFCHISLGRKFNQSTSVHTYTDQKKIFNYIYYELKNSTFDINPKITIDTKSNLKFKVFDIIINQLGIDGSWYTTKEIFIDKNLLNKRNAIAHGENRKDITLADFILLKDNILEFLEFFHKLILESFEKKVFLLDSDES